MNDLILSKMREGDWGEVVRLMREAYGTAPEAVRREGRNDMPFRERFDTVRITPQKVADSVIEENGRFAGITFEGEKYKPSRRFLKGLAQRMKVSLSIFELFSPLEVVRRAAERAPELPLRLTIDRQDHQVLGLIEDKGVPIPAGNIEIIMKDDRRLQKFDYRDGVITGQFDLGEAWDVPNDSKYGVHVITEVPVDGMGTPEATLATWREVCSNGAIAEAPIFRTKMEVKDSSGEHFRRLLTSFSNPRGVEMLHTRLIIANETKASVDEVYRAESFIRRQVRDARHQMLLCERLQEVSDNPCVRYGVTDLGAIGERRRALLPTGASVADVMSFVSELNTHHGALLKNVRSANELLGDFYAKSYDLEEMYPHTQPASGFYLRGIDFEEKARG